MQKSLFEIPQLNEAQQPPLQQCSVSRSTFYQGDCLVEMDKIADKSVDMILCDLPYGTTDCKWEIILDFDMLWLQYKRVIKDSGAIVMTAREPFTSKLVVSNMLWYKHKWVWNKKQSGSFQNAKYMPLQIEEDIIVFGKGKINYYPQMRKGVMRKKGGRKDFNETMSGLKPNYFTENDDYYPVNIIEFTKETGLHPTQKPVELMEYLIKTYTNEGETVLDNCMGSGTTGVACKKTGRHFIGIEKDEKYFELAVRRVSEYCG
jgi:site-specific DNA-methyltransferase (adenine-specific)